MTPGEGIATAREALASGVARKTAHEMLGNQDPAVCACGACGWERGNGQRYVSPPSFTPAQLARMSFGDVEDMRRNGRVREEDWAAYAHVWRTMSGRMSSLAAAYEAAPTDPLVIEIAAGIRAAVEERQARP